VNAILKRLDKIETSLSNKTEDNWLNINGVRDYTSLSIPKIRKAVRGGELKVSRSGGRLLFKKSWVDKWLND
tara:strand:+ start:1191 stop:1406 length:216 start_codon:yes stop_codon:yes gene_type:complete